MLVKSVVNKYVRFKISFSDGHQRTVTEIGIV
jgi:hypothetical protein